MRKSSQSSDSHKFFNKRLSFKTNYNWKKCDELHKNFDIKFMLYYYWVGLTNNQIHKLRFMDLEARLHIAWSDIEELLMA